MNNTQPFGKDHAPNYDTQWKKMAPMKEGLHFLMKIIFGELPEKMNVLCVGAGTGSEILFLAETFPTWTFTAVDPAEAMLEVCRQKMDEVGFLSRCRFHAGYLSTLPGSEKYDVATSILVSQFLPDPSERKVFFEEIAARLKPGSYLISSDLASPETTDQYNRLIEEWNKSLRFAGFTEERVQLATSAWRKEVAVSKPKEIEAIIASTGFEALILFHQSLFIHSWFTKLKHHS